MTLTEQDVKRIICNMIASQELNIRVVEKRAPFLENCHEKRLIIEHQFDGYKKVLLNKEI